VPTSEAPIVVPIIAAQFAIAIKKQINRTKIKEIRL
jgi:hypothetical protein